MSALNVMLAELASSRRPDTDGIEISIGMLKHIAAQHATEVEQARKEGAEIEGQRLRDAAVAEADFYQTEAEAGPAARAVVDAIDAAIRARGGSNDAS